MNIANKDNCTGCGLCSKLCPTKAIQMLPNEEGFSYPCVNAALCIDCGKCVSGCPLEQSASGNDPIHIFAAKHNNTQVRQNCTSGGIFPALADHVLLLGGSVYGAGFDGPKKVIHKRITADRRELSDSKYVQSNILDSYEQVKSDLENGMPVLFTGTPCQVHALKLFIKDPKLLRNLYLCDFVCHGVPSPELYEAHLSHLEKSHKNTITKVEFRAKRLGWDKTNKRYLICSLADGREIKDTLYYKLYFTYNIISRPSCSTCIYAKQARYSDITIGDFWGCDQQFSKDGMGVSLVMTNSEKGESLFAQIRDSFTVLDSDFAAASRENVRLTGPTVFGSWRQGFWYAYRKKGYRSAVTAFCGKSILDKLRRKMFVYKGRAYK